MSTNNNLKAMLTITKESDVAILTERTKTTRKNGDTTTNVVYFDIPATKGIVDIETFRAKMTANYNAIICHNYYDNYIAPLKEKIAKSDKVDNTDRDELKLMEECYKEYASGKNVSPLYTFLARVYFNLLNGYTLSDTATDIVNLIDSRLIGMKYTPLDKAQLKTVNDYVNTLLKGTLGLADYPELKNFKCDLTNYDIEQLTLIFHGYSVRGTFEKGVTKKSLKAVAKWQQFMLWALAEGFKLWTNDAKVKKPAKRMIG